MTNSMLLPCDGCGRLADSAHISRRLKRLAWATRFRPIHIQALLVSGIAPPLDSDYLYSLDEPFQGEASTILHAVPLATEGKPREAVLAEFQKLGLMLVHVLECSPGEAASRSELASLLAKQLPAAIIRIRRSLKPKRVLLLSSALEAHAARLHEANLGCPVLPATSGTFLTTTPPSEAELQTFRMAL